MSRKDNIKREKKKEPDEESVNFFIDRLLSILTQQVEESEQYIKK